ncbi:hypothetical protein SO802_030920 [Lithocarpus litseifolius]|uniref:Uncharacterized protein n=1 Tax=Lithocarpus litseifolius TaxID=425828 RepID=A0AAW2BMD5_9ROSI
MASNSNSFHPPPQTNGSTGPSRVPKEEFSWLCMLIVTLSIILFLCLFAWLILSRDDPLPDVKLHNFSVSKFQTLDSRLVAEWVANFTTRVALYDASVGSSHPVFVPIMTFEYLESFVSYKGHILAVKSTNIVQDKSEIMTGYTNISVKFSTEGLEGDQREVQDWVLEEIRKDKDTGTVIFGMQLVIWTPRYRWSYWARCSNLTVDFNQPDWVATLGNHDARLKIFFDPFTCIVYYKEGPLFCASIAEPIHLGPMIQKTVHIRFDRMGCGCEQPFAEDQVLEEIVEDGASGTLQFSVRMHIKADYGISFWLYNMVIKSQCPDLKVEFV